MPNRFCWFSANVLQTVSKKMLQDDWRNAESPFYSCSIIATCFLKGRHKRDRKERGRERERGMTTAPLTQNLARRISRRLRLACRSVQWGTSTRGPARGGEGSSWWCFGCGGCCVLWKQDSHQHQGAPSLPPVPLLDFHRWETWDLEWRAERMGPSVIAASAAPAWRHNL